MNAKTRSLDDLRHEVDEIDRQIHTLIQQRGGLAVEISEVKNRCGLDKVRPGREADLLRELVKRHKGSFPIGGVLRIWREIISSVVTMEMPNYSIAVYAHDEHQGFWDLARDQFGSQTPMTGHTNVRDAISQVFKGEAAFAVVPRPTEDTPGLWWQYLCAPDAPQILYRLPFFGRGNARAGIGEVLDALAIGRMKPEETGKDCSAFVMETIGEFSRTGLAKFLSSADLQPMLMVPSGVGQQLCYCEVKGFVIPDDARLRRLESFGEIERLTVIGHYATPIGNLDKFASMSEE